MQRALWTAASGMGAQQLNIDVIAHNLANVNTSGFKRGRAEFEDLLYQTVKSPGGATSSTTRSPSGLQVGLGTRTAAVKKIHSQGDFKKTDSPLDLVIEGRGFFKVLRPDGNLAYTRDGAFTLNKDGNLVSPQGYLLDPPVTLPSDAKFISVGRDGTVTAVQPGSPDAIEVGSIELASFINPGGLRAEGGNLFAPTASSGDALLGTPGQEGLGELAQGFLEISNVSIVQELVDMIAAQRAYELNSRAVKAADEMLQKVTELVR